MLSSLQYFSYFRHYFVWKKCNAISLGILSLSSKFPDTNTIILTPKNIWGDLTFGWLFFCIWNLSLSKCLVEFLPKIKLKSLADESLHLQIWLTCLFCCSTGQWWRWSSGPGTSSLQSSQTVLTPGGRVWSLDPSWHSDVWPGASGTDQGHDIEVLKVFLLNWQLK